MMVLEVEMLDQQLRREMGITPLPVILKHLEALLMLVKAEELEKLKGSRIMVPRRMQ